MIDQTVINALYRVAARDKRLDVPRILGLLLQEKMRSFVVGETSVIVLALTKQGNSHIYAAAGKISELVAALPGIEYWSWLHGAKVMTIAGRVGWERVLKSHGYRKRDSWIQKDLP